MKIGFPIGTNGKGGATSWVKTFSDYCISMGYDVFFNTDEEVDVLITLANYLSLEKIMEYEKRNTKIIYRMDGIYFDYLLEDNKKVELFNKQVRDSISHADRVIYQSNFSKDLVKLLFDGKEIPGDIIYNGADTKVFKPEGDVLLRPIDKKIILSIAYWGTPLMANYSIHAILKIAKEFLDNEAIEFWILGLAYPETEKLIQDANLPNITKYDLKTPIKREDMPKYIRTADMILHTRSNDACSNLIVEAMNVGIPIVGLNSGSTPELLGDAGLLCECKPSYDEFPEINIKDMAHKIRQTFEHYDVIKNKIKERAILFTQDIMCEKYIDQIKLLVKE
ncbi:MAG: hypothetical protein CVU84_12165 [Firmicutes bacterium HGW-Firmicutes-1]|jgi:glycosyltransferase involved in cell wall biosynthesis|nr:MAG: hypothetical protein CVU84_12165 [Firmicutes bacterium HGW-Firmicutes-1]